MQVIDRPAHDAPARVLALLVAANGHIHAEELTLLPRPSPPTGVSAEKNACSTTMRWRINSQQVSEAIRRDPMH